MSISIEKIKDYGIVGAGGAGFPTYVKLQNKVEKVILNGAECEPLLHKDKELLKKYASKIVNTLDEIINFTGAKSGVIAVKEKYTSVFDALKPYCSSKITIFPLGDFYPAGDEIILANIVTGKIIPPGSIPLDVGLLVTNVETVFNIAKAEPVTASFLTLAGAVPTPATFIVPIGTMVKDLLIFAGVTDMTGKSLIFGGAMMGKLVENLDEPIVKTTGGIIVLPTEHPLIKKYQRSKNSRYQIASSSCDQCSICTDMCPRFLLGHNIKPHLAMRALQMPSQIHELNVGTYACCYCNLCSLVACPIDLDPKEICFQYNENYPNYTENKSISRLELHPMAAERRVSLNRLKDRLGLTEYDKKAPLNNQIVPISQVKIPLKQHIGTPAEPIVKLEEFVNKGQKIASVPTDKLGVPIHASISGIIQEICSDFIQINSKV